VTSRERVMAALNGLAPDRIPIALGFYPVSAEHVLPAEWPMTDAIDVQFVSLGSLPALERFRRKALPFRPDTRLGNEAQAYTYRRWRYRPQRATGQNPLAAALSIGDIATIRFPGEAASPRTLRRCAAEVSEIHARGMAAGGTLPHLGGEMFESAWRLRGLENFILDIHDRPELAHALLDRLTDFAVRNAETIAATGIDILSLGDDVGMPGSMMIGPRPWREFFKARLARVIAAARSAAPGIAVLYHSDGWFEPIIGDLVEIGVDAINPVQPEHMDAAGIRRRFGPSPALWGTVGTQSAFARAKPAEIRQEVARRIRELGPRGLILSPAYDIDTPEISKENVAAFLAAAREYG
jgi:hypothetical protein